MTLIRRTRWTLPFLTVSMFTACGRPAPQITAPVVALLPGVLELEGTRLPIEAPATASVGVPVTVTVYTIGGGCTRIGPTTASVQGLVAVIAPFDSVVTELPPNWGCPSNIAGLEHTATVQFAAPGTAILQFVGRREPGDTALVIEHTITIQ